MGLNGTKTLIKPRPVAAPSITEVLGPMLDQLLTCAEAAIDPVGRAFIATGQVSWDDCCGGQLWVRLVSLESLAPNFAKLGATSLHPCGLEWTATVGIGVLRCSSIVNDSGQLAPADTFTAEALQVLADEAAICQAIYCCEVLPLNRYDITRWDPLGPEGGCVGGEWTMTMQVNNYGCSDT
jgi:hypothetical protein